MVDHSFDVSIVGLGFIVHSPSAVRHINDGEDYLSNNFWDPEDVGRHVTECQLTGFGTGSPGDFQLHIFDGQYPEGSVVAARSAVRLGVEIRESTLCIRDLYSLLDWDSNDDPLLEIHLEDGFYRLTVFTSPPMSGIIGDNQLIEMHFSRVPKRPELKWNGVPDLSCGPQTINTPQSGDA